MKDILYENYLVTLETEIEAVHVGLGGEEGCTYRIQKNIRRETFYDLVIFETAVLICSLAKKK